MGLEKRLHIKADIAVNFSTNEEYISNFKKKLLDKFSVSELSNNGNALIKGKVTGMRSTLNSSVFDNTPIKFRIEKNTSLGSLRILHIRYDYISKGNKVPDIPKVYEAIDDIVELVENSRYDF